MPAWSDVAAATPDLAERVRARFAAYRHATLATLRADGRPRTSGTETQFRNGELWLAGMGGARKADDLRRDGRLALHSTMADEKVPDGDARITGVATEITDRPTIEHWQGEQAEMPPGAFHLFRVDITELMLVWVDGDHLVVESWTPASGTTRVERR